MTIHAVTNAYFIDSQDYYCNVEKNTLFLIILVALNILIPFFQLNVHMLFSGIIFLLDCFYYNISHLCESKHDTFNLKYVFPLLC